MLKNYADRLFSRDEIIWVPSPKDSSHILEMFNEIKDCKHRRHNRTEDELIENITMGKAIEFAVSQRLGIDIVTGVKFDHRDPNTYAYDLIDRDNNVKFECKTHCIKWFSFYEDQMNAILSRAKHHDYIVTANVKDYGDRFGVTPMLIISSRTFDRNICPPDRGKKWFYNHFSGQRSERCVHNPYA